MALSSESHSELGSDHTRQGGDRRRRLDIVELMEIAKALKLEPTAVGVPRSHRRGARDENR